MALGLKPPRPAHLTWARLKPGSPSTTGADIHGFDTWPTASAGRHLATTKDFALLSCSVHGNDGPESTRPAPYVPRRLRVATPVSIPRAADPAGRWCARAESGDLRPVHPRRLSAGARLARSTALAATAGFLADLANMPSWPAGLDPHLSVPGTGWSRPHGRLPKSGRNGVRFTPGDPWGLVGDPRFHRCASLMAKYGHCWRSPAGREVHRTNLPEKVRLALPTRRPPSSWRSAQTRPVRPGTSSWRASRQLVADGSTGRWGSSRACSVAS